MGAARPQTPRRSPRQAFGGNWVLTHLGGKEPKQQNQPQISSNELSNLRGQVTAQKAPLRGQSDHYITIWLRGQLRGQSDHCITIWIDK